MGPGWQPVGERDRGAWAGDASWASVREKVGAGRTGLAAAAVGKHGLDRARCQGLDRLADGFIYIFFQKKKTVCFYKFRLTVTFTKR